MNKIISKKRLKDISKDFENCTVFSNSHDLKLVFSDCTILFEEPLVYKFGYPNNEVSHYTNVAKAIEAEDLVLYKLKDTEWIKSIIKLNSNHPKHSDKLFESFYHFLIFFEDNTFECLATDYKIIQS